MPRPKSTAENTSRSKMKKNPNKSDPAEQSASSKSPSPKKKLEPPKKNEEAAVTELLKTLPPLPPLTPSKKICRVPYKKNPEKIKTLQVPNVGNESIPKLVQVKALPPNFAAMPKLQRINIRSMEPSSAIMKPTNNVSPAEKTKSSPNTLQVEKSSNMPLLHEIDTSCPPTAQPPQPLSKVSNAQLSKNIIQISKMKIDPSVLKKTAPVHASNNTKSSMASPKNMTVPKPNIFSLNELKKQVSNVKPNPSTKEPSPPNVNVNKRQENPEKHKEYGRRRPARGARKKNSDTSEHLPKVESTYIADGLREDCQNFVGKCLQVFKLNFEKFSEIWKQMNFSCIFHGRQSGAELAEFSEEAIHIAKWHMLARNVTYEENVAGLFLVYAFLNHQPFKGFAALRLVPEDVPAVLYLEAEARKQRRYDVLYILGNVLIKGPCEYHVLPREVALEMPIRKYHDGSVQVSGPSVESVFTKTAECVQYFKELVGMDQRYAAMRQKLRERKSGVDRVRNLCSQPAAELFSMYKSHVPGGMVFDRDIEDAITPKSPPKEESRQDLVKSIKERAMGNLVDSMRHLTGIEERQQDNSPEIIDLDSPKSTPRSKGKGKGKGRSSARTLQCLFTPEEDLEQEVAPQPPATELPILHMSEHSITVTHLPLSTPMKRLPTLSPCQTDNPPTKRIKTNTDLTKNASTAAVDKPIPEKPVNLDTNLVSTTAANDKNAQKPKRKPKTKKNECKLIVSDSDFDPDEIVNIPIDILTPENTETKQNIATNEKNEPDTVKKGTTSKNNAKNIKIKAIQIVKPAKATTSLKAVPNEEINIKLDSIPVEVHSGVNNIEIEIIDNYKETTEVATENETSNAISKNDSSIVEVNKESTPNKSTSESPKDVNESGTLKTELVKTRGQRRKGRQSKKVQIEHTEKSQRNVGEGDISKLDGDAKTEKDPSPKQVADPAKPDNTPLIAEDSKTARSLRRERRNTKRLRIKSTFKKMGILEVADMKDSDSDK